MILFLDRTNTANARIEGLEAGLNMPPTDYSTALWIFYVPFILVEIPSNLILMTGFEGLTASYRGLWAIRFFLGAFEVALPAGVAYMLSMYYTNRESSVRFAWSLNFALAGPIFSGLLAYGLVNLDGVGGLQGWRWQRDAARRLMSEEEREAYDELHFKLAY
ncbi:high-affinity nicotinic acid transporter [Diaporthe helianthi]|uniref:High-affinity nicotinic acid transporter n=1 Tax=Diaporthe helianthi TaxID=158607 RepID=A0A2P5HNC2_DIAHE|nr:high-affinity nicotinic acid transporter [Diaporthe helianthi]